MATDKQVDALRVVIDGDASGLYRTLATAHNKMLDFEHSTGAVNAAIRRMALGVGLAFGGAIKLALDFDKAMIRSNMTLGATPEQFAKVREDVKALTAQTTHSAKELGASLEYLAQAGLRLGEISRNGYQVVKFVSAFARTGNFELKTATDLLTDAGTAMVGVIGTTEDVVENMFIVGNKLTQVASAANTSVSQISQAITNKAGPAMKMFNISLDDGLTLLATYASQGKKGAAAGSLLEQTFRYLSQAVSKNEEAFKSHNIVTWGDDGVFRMKEFIDSMTEVLSDKSPVEKFRFLTEELGMTAKTMMGIFPIIGMGGERWDDLTKKIEEAADVQERLNQFVSSASGIWQVFVNRLQVVGVEFGESLMPQFKGFLLIGLEMIKVLVSLAKNPFFMSMVKYTLVLGAATLTVLGLSIAYQGLAKALSFGARLVAVLINPMKALAATQTGVAATAKAAEMGLTGYARAAFVAKTATRALLRAFLPIALALTAIEFLLSRLKTDVADFDMDIADLKQQEQFAEDMQAALDQKVFTINLDPIISSKRLEDSYIQQIAAFSNRAKTEQVRQQEGAAILKPLIDNVMQGVMNDLGKDPAALARNGGARLESAESDLGEISKLAKEQGLSSPELLKQISDSMDRLVELEEESGVALQDENEQKAFDRRLRSATGGRSSFAPSSPGQPYGI